MFNPNNKVKPILAAILICILLMIFSGCSKSSDSSTNSGPATPGSNQVAVAQTDAIAKILADQNLDADLREILETKTEKLPPTSFDLIEKDFESGVLTKEAAVLLKLTAAFSPEKLAQKYRSDLANASMPHSDELRRDIQWIINNFDEFDGALQEKFRPFILKPDNPESFFKSG